MLHCIRDKKPNDWESDISLPEFTSRVLTQVGNFVGKYFQSRDYVETDDDTADPKILAEAKAAKGRLKLATQVSDTSPARILDNMKMAKEEGADIAVIAPPFGGTSIQVPDLEHAGGLAENHHLPAHGCVPAKSRIDEDPPLTVDFKFISVETHVTEEALHTGIVSPARVPENVLPLHPFRKGV